VVSKAREAFLAPNIDRKGRLARALYGCAMIVAGWLLNRANHRGLGVAAIPVWCLLKPRGVGASFAPAA